MITESFEDATLNVLIKKQHYLNLIKRVDSVEGAISVCKDLKIDISDIIFHSDDTKDEIAYKEIKIITKALNEGWKPNWNDTNEPKYYPWFDLRGSTFVFGNVDYGSYGTITAGASRLCFKSKELAEYAGRTFINKYKNLIL